ncbi:hypothetical protein JHK87_055283 [Glycine soja]|nr:hypothetical protein JHK87_055283 [Glycine soja]
MLYERPRPKSVDKETMGYVVVIAIPKEEYREGLEDCKSYLHSRILLAKGVPPPRVSDLQAKALASFGTLTYGPNWKRLLHFFFLLSSRFTCWDPLYTDDAMNSGAFGRYAWIFVDVDLDRKLRTTLSGKERICLLCGYRVRKTPFVFYLLPQ